MGVKVFIEIEGDEHERSKKNEPSEKKASRDC